MKTILSLTLIAAIVSFLPSCETNVNARGQARTNGHSHHRSSTGLNANLGANIRL